MNGLRAALEQTAHALGFDRLLVAEAQALSQWRREAGPGPRWAALQSDPGALLPGARRAIVLLRAYRPFLPRPGEATLSAYYPCSQRAYLDAPALCAPLAARGFSALARPPLPVKPVLALSGGTRYGRNGLTAAQGLGSRYAAQVILTDAPLPVDAPSPVDFPDCASCGACLRACPAGALGGAKVDADKCLRGLPEGLPVPEALRPLIGASLLGCDLCQDVCPRNRGIDSLPMPPELADALSLERLLAGDVKPLIPFIGPNYARKKRVQARSCLIAANLGRADCLPLIRSLRDDEAPPVRLHARWAADVLEGVYSSSHLSHSLSSSESAGSSCAMR